MPPSSESSRSGTAVLFSAPGLSVVALVLFGLFASQVAAVLFPLQLFDPAWQLRLAGTLINTAAFPLLGLALLQIAAELGPHDPQLKSRARLCSQLAVATAASNADLNQQLQKLSGPVLGPADIAQPLPLLKAQVGAVLDQAALQISREREASQPRTRLQLLPDLLRNALASLALALGFGALARRPGSSRTVLQELQSSRRRSSFGGAGRRRRGSSGSGG